MIENKKSLSTIIKELANSSMLADRIATRLASTSSTVSLETVTSLKTGIRQLKLELQRLRGIIEVLQLETSDKLEVSFTDEQEHAFLTSIEVTLQQMSLSQLRFGYNKEVLRAYDTRVRYLVALALVNNCGNRNLPSDPFWQEIVTKNGIV